jgi:hypothetical protein
MRLLSPRQPLDVYRVMKYNTRLDNETDYTVKYLRGEPLDYNDDEYLEFRIQWKTDTYRYVVDRNHPSYPTYVDFSVRGRLQIVKAVLINKPEMLFDDVTDRVRKFHGPSVPFFGRRLTCSHLFRNDDVKEGYTICIVNADGEMFQFDYDDIIDLNNNQA